MGRLRPKSTFLFVACAAAVGCSSGYTASQGSEPDTLNLDEDAGTTDPQHPTGGSDGGGGGTMMQRDAGPPTMEPDAGPPKGTFCTSDAGATLLACDDFDQSSMLEPMWKKQEQGGGTVALDSMSFVSAPSSILASIPAHSTNYMYHQLEVQTGIGSGAFALEFDMFLTADLANSGSGIDTNYMCPIELYTDQYSYASVCVGKTEAAAYIVSFAKSTNGDSVKVPFNSTLPLNAWHHYRIAFSFTSNGTISVAMDGTTLGTSASTKTAVTGSAAPLYVYPDLGLDSVGNWGNSTARFDNMRLTQQ